MNQIYYDDENIRAYYIDTKRFKQLPKEEEVALAERIQEGDICARDKLVQANLRFVLTVAIRFINQGLNFGDLIASGNLGILEAAIRYNPTSDPSHNVKFISYAVWWIRQSIQQAIIEHARTVRLPANKLELLTRLSVLTRNLETIDIKELARLLDISENEVSVLLEIEKGTISGDIEKDLPKGGRGTTLLEIFRDQSQILPDERVIQSSEQAAIKKLLDSLGDKAEDKRMSKIVILYFGLFGEEPHTLEEIGTTMGLTRERVRQIKEKALARLRYISIEELEEHFQDWEQTQFGGNIWVFRDARGTWCDHKPNQRASSYASLKALSEYLSFFHLLPITPSHIKKVIGFIKVKNCIEIFSAYYGIGKYANPLSRDAVAELLELSKAVVSNSKAVCLTFLESQESGERFFGMIMQSNKKNAKKNIQNSQL